MCKERKYFHSYIPCCQKEGLLWVCPWITVFNVSHLSFCRSLDSVRDCENCCISSSACWTRVKHEFFSREHSELISELGSKRARAFSSLLNIMIVFRLTWLADWCWAPSILKRLHCVLPTVQWDMFGNYVHSFWAWRVNECTTYSLCLTERESVRSDQRVISKCRRCGIVEAITDTGTPDYWQSISILA